jgi:hypothetical protein
MRPLILSAIVLALAACRSDPDKPETDTIPGDTGPNAADQDGDGYGPDDDCDDSDASVHPGAHELCDGLDNDCDGAIDEEAVDAETFYTDADGDGYGDPEAAVLACEADDGLVDDATDCDDGDAETHPDAPERCDGLDNDCDGEIDEDLQELWYGDGDGDGWGDPAITVESCDPGSGWVEVAEDCDDANSAIHPEAEEVCDALDNDCDGAVDEELETPWYADADGDGYGDPATEQLACEAESGWVAEASDCDDGNSAVNPAATEICNAIDDDCDGLIDDEDDSVTGTSTWYADADGDGYGDDAVTSTACEQPDATSAFGGDCDDRDAAYNPGAAEDCTDPTDYNCDGSTGYADADGDGWAACEDCDDSDAAVSPDAEELCDGVDNDCDGGVDEAEATDAGTWYADADGDGYGDPAATVAACSQPSGYVSGTYATDCDDSDPDVSPVDPELCDGVDNDCDGAIDEGVTSTFHADSDGDGYGDAATTSEACAASTGWVVDDSDCDDADDAVHPGATELCNGVDDDCDGYTDDEDPGVTGTTTWYVDADGDGYGGPRISEEACEQPSGFVADATDCDDLDASSHPGAEELCDGADNDCDGTADEADASDASTWYADADGDGYGDAGSTEVACTEPAGFVSDDADCDDGDAAINPGAAEVCTDAIDHDCDGDTGYADADGDGWAACEDCDDADAGVSPVALESCNGVDDDCDGSVDEDDALDAATWYADGDGDGYGDASSTTAACIEPTGFVSDATDCDDSNAVTHPGAAEICDGVDNDCDGDLDEGATTTFYADADGDGWGDAGSGVEACASPSGYVSDADDCDDTDAGVHPGATETCNGVDDDCDGDVDEDSAVDVATWYLDHDADGYGTSSYGVSACSQPSGYVADGTDCNDWDDDDHPGADERCDGVDNDCDGDVDEDSAVDVATWYLDADLDGYGVPDSVTEACDQPSGFAPSELDEDCDDGDATINPGADDVCDGIDQDCDGVVDDDAHEGKFMLTVDTNHGYAYEIDTATAGSAAVSALDSGYTINSVAVDEDGWAVGNEYSADTLVEIDPCTGSITTIGSTGVGNACGISFGPGGKLYGMDNSSDQLVEFDTTTAAATVIGSMGYDVSSCGMAYDCTNDVLYGATANGDVIFKLDATTGLAYDVVTTAVPFSSVGIEYDPATGLIWAATGTDLYSVDPSDGSTVFIGPLGGTNVDDLVHYPVCE